MGSLRDAFFQRSKFSVQRSTFALLFLFILHPSSFIHSSSAATFTDSVNRVVITTAPLPSSSTTSSTVKPTTTVPPTTTTSTVPPTTTTSTVAPSNTPTLQLSIPPTHPRILGDSATYARLYSHWQAAAFDPGSDPFSLALAYRMTKSATYARTAINWLMAYQIPAGQATTTAIGSDNSRWDGENAILVFDWCWDQMTATERATIIARWNTWLAAINQQTWGGVGMDMNNYYWGNLRNSLLWGIASFGENTQAQSFLDHALVTRWKNSFMPFALGGGAGGIAHEGPSYGAAMYSYPLIPFEASRLLGRNLWNETPWFADGVKYLWHATTPAKVMRKGQTVARYELFPFNDYENYPGGFNILNERKYHGDFATVAANVWSNQPIGQLARAWLNQVQPARSWYAIALDQSSSFILPPSSLPLDYVTPLKAYTRRDWTTNSIVWEITIGKTLRSGHSHRDGGSVQAVGPNGWITRASAGYGNSLSGGGDSGTPQAQNLLVINGVGPLPDSWQKAAPVVLSSSSSPSSFSIAVDLTGIYRATADFAGRVPEAPISKYIATYTFDRASGAVTVSCDITATSATTADFLIHSEVNPPRWTSIPSAVLDVDEGANGQFRFKVTKPLLVGANNLTITITPK